jgi:hypothetical protein
MSSSSAPSNPSTIWISFEVADYHMLAMSTGQIFEKLTSSLKIAAISLSGLSVNSFSEPSELESSVPRSPSSESMEDESTAGMMRREKG